jgi:TM2 domain-containing membrane protein YozV
MTKTKSKKSYAIAVCLSAVFGIIGVQHFYLGRYFLGLTDLSLSILAVYCFISGQFLYALLFLGLDFFHSLIITIRLLTGSFEDGEGCIVCYPGQELNKH